MIQARWEPYQQMLIAVAPALIAFAVTLAVGWLIRRFTLHWLSRVSTGPSSLAAVAADTLGMPSLLWCLAAALDVSLRYARLNEVYMRRAMLLSRGDPMVFLERPISAGMLAVAAIALIAMLMPAIRKGKDSALQEGG